MSKRKSIRVKAGEDLSPANIERVIAYLNSEEEKPTKKVACNMLGITYNTSRLSSIIDNYIEKKERDAAIRKKKRGTPITNEEKISMIESYFETGSFESVADTHYRPVAKVKEVIEENGADFKNKATDYFHPKLLPELSMADSFTPGEVVWAARTNSLAIIKKPCKGGYWVRTLGGYSQNCAHATEELGSLKHLTEMGVNLDRVVNMLSMVE